VDSSSSKQTNLGGKLKALGCCCYCYQIS